MSNLIQEIVMPLVQINSLREMESPIVILINEGCPRDRPGDAVHAYSLYVQNSVGATGYKGFSEIRELASWYKRHIEGREDIDFTLNIGKKTLEFWDLVEK